jgi:hypothetical protein
MPQQSPVSGYIYFPDGCKISADFGSGYSDLGVVKGGFKASLGWKENRVHFGGGGYSSVQVKDMVIAASMVLYNLNLSNIASLSAGSVVATATPGTAHSSIPNQIIPANWSDNTKYNLIMYNTSADHTNLKMATAPALTSVTLYDSSSPEALSAWGAGAGGDYEVVADNDSPSGWSIIFNSAGMVLGTPKTRYITIVYASNTPVATETVTTGWSSKILTAYKVKFVHTDSAGLTRGGEIYSVTPKSPFDFSIKGVDDNELEEMPISFEGYCDPNLTDGAALLSVWADVGAA